MLSLSVCLFGGWLVVVMLSFLLLLLLSLMLLLLLLSLLLFVDTNADDYVPVVESMAVEEEW